jgi:hypothetical protein
MSRRFLLALAAAALLGAGAAALASAWKDDGGSAPSPPPAPRARLASNQIRLSRAESLRLVGWARRFRACMARRGVELAVPVAHPKQIDLALERPAAGDGLAGKVVACGDALGEPPRRSSLQLRPGKLVLYLPRRCLLDPKVAKAGTAS